MESLPGYSHYISTYLLLTAHQQQSQICSLRCYLDQTHNQMVSLPHFQLAHLQEALEKEKMIQDMLVFQAIAPIVTKVVELDAKIQEEILKKTPNIVSDNSAIEHFEDALLSNPELLKAMPQYSDCIPLLEERNSEVSKLQSITGKSQTSAVEFRKLKDLLSRKEEV